MPHAPRRLGQSRRFVSSRTIRAATAGFDTSRWLWLLIADAGYSVFSGCQLSTPPAPWLEKLGYLIV